MKISLKRIIFFGIFVGIIALLNTSVYAASVSITAPSSVNVNEPCTIKITGSGAATYKGTSAETTYGLTGNLFTKLYTRSSNTLGYIFIYHNFTKNY